MTVTTDAVDTSAVAKKKTPAATPEGVDAELVGQLVEQARGAGLQLTGEGGLLQQLTKRVIEAALDGEITDHLGYEKHDPAGKDGGNSRNGTRAKTVLTDIGPVEITVPRDRDGSFEPQIVRKRQRRLTGVEDMVLSLSAKGLTTGEISAHLAEVYGADVSRQTISTITDKVMDGMLEWQNRPLDRVYPVIFLDAINVKIRDGKVANRPIYVALAVTAEGTRDILGLWAGDGGEGAKFWLNVCTELKNRGVEDVLMAVCDGLTGLPDAINTVWSETVVQTCVVHLLRNSFKYASRQHWDTIRESAQAGLHRTDRGRRRATVPRVRRSLGRQVSGNRQAVGERLGRVRAVADLRRRDPQGRLLDQRDRKRQRPHPPGRASSRALPERASRPEMRLPRRHGIGPDRHRTPPLDHPLETRSQRLRPRLRRPPVRRPQLTHQQD